MRLVQRVTAYDKLTERLAFDFDLPDDGLRLIEETGRREHGGALPLSRDLIEKLAPRLEIPSNAIDRCDWFLEPFASEEVVTTRS